MSKQIQAKQQKTLVIIVGILLLIGGALYLMLQNSVTPPAGKDKVVKMDFATPLTHVDEQAMWRERGQNEIVAQQKTTSALNQQVALLKQDKASDEQNLQQLQSEVNALSQKLASQQNTVSDGTIASHTLPLTVNPLYKTSSLPTPDNYVPAGTFVRAVTLGGADASAGVTSQGNPSPMEYRILDNGTLPNHFHSHLKGCFVTAAAIGDISSERGEVRSERLSCVDDKGNIIDVPVQATIFGPDGKNGVRGKPVWREQALLERAFTAGLFSGISNGIAQSYTTNALTPWGQVQTVDNHKILQYGLASGIGNAADKLADYNIKRADQYHPVIQLSAGTMVDIVFLKGFYLHKSPTAPTGDSEAPDDSANNPNFLSNTPTATPQPLPLTPAQIAALKQKDAAQGYF